jgi:hypothetical protein
MTEDTSFENPDRFYLVSSYGGYNDGYAGGGGYRGSDGYDDRGGYGGGGYRGGYEDRGGYGDRGGGGYRGYERSLHWSRASIIPYIT